MEVTGSGPFRIELDKRPLKTPLINDLAVPTSELAEAIAKEWRAQGDQIDPSTMPLTRLANTAIDRVGGREMRIIREIVDYASSDLVCYRASAPTGLVIREEEHWDPILSWAAEYLGATFLAVKGISHCAQPDEALGATTRYLQQFDPMGLCALHNIATVTGSALIALAIEAGSLEPNAAWLAAHVDEDWQIQQWGSDKEAEERRSHRKHEFDSAVRLLQLLSHRARATV